MKADTLRKSILQYAIQGKLVPQIDTEESASELLKKIKAEKQELIKQGTIKKEKDLPPITDGKKSFDIPDSWEWVRVGQFANIINGFTPLRTNSEFWNKKEISWFTVNDIQTQGRIINTTSQYISKSALSEKSNRILPPNTLLLCCTASIGEYAITKIELTTNQQFNGIYPKELYTHAIDMMYLFSIAPIFKDILMNLAGITTFPFVSVKKVENIVVPIPPLAEQQRIVDRIEELMALVDEYEKKEVELSKLEKEFPEKLKKSILQYAIQGKLVPQITTEEPASELLKKIKAEKQELIKQGKIKKQKDLPPIKDEEKPFDIPESWEWVRLGDLCNKLTDGAHQTPKYTENGVPFISVKDISKGKIDFSDTKFISEEEHKKLYERCNPQKGDLLLTKVGTTGIPVIVDTDVEFSLFVSVALLKISNKYLHLKYLCNLIKSPHVYMQAQENTKGVGNKNWVMRDIANTLVPLPPITEQQRIVSRIEELFTLVDVLAEGKKLPKETVTKKNKDNILSFVSAKKDETKHRIDVSSFKMAARDSDSVKAETMEKVLEQVQAYYDKKN